MRVPFKIFNSIIVLNSINMITNAQQAKNIYDNYQVGLYKKRYKELDAYLCVLLRQIEDRADSGHNWLRVELKQEYYQEIPVRLQQLGFKIKLTDAALVSFEICISW